MRYVNEVSVHGLAGVRGAANPQVGAVIATRSAFARKMYGPKSASGLGGLGCPSCLGSASSQGLSPMPGADEYKDVYRYYNVPTVRHALLWAHHRKSDDPSTWGPTVSYAAFEAAAMAGPVVTSGARLAAAKAITQSVENTLLAAERGDRAAQEDIVASLAYAHAAKVITASSRALQDIVTARLSAEKAAAEAAKQASDRARVEAEAVAKKAQDAVTAYAQQQAAQAAAQTEKQTQAAASGTGVGVGTIALLGGAAVVAFFLLRG